MMDDMGHDTNQTLGESPGIVRPSATRGHLCTPLHGYAGKRTRSWRPGGPETRGTTACCIRSKSSRFLAHALLTGNGPTHLPTNPLLYTGGAIGVAFIAVAAYLAQPLGVLTLAMSTIAGQIVGSVALDLLAPTATTHLTPLTLAGAALTLVAAAITAGVRPRRR